MDAILSFFNEMRRSDWVHDVPFTQRKYNGITVQESAQSYYNKITPMYDAAVVALVSVPTEKYEILQSLLDEVEDSQKYFEIPSDELLNSLICDYNQSNNTVRGLKEDYDYLCFVRKCMNMQMYFLKNFKNKFPMQQAQKIEIVENKEVPNATEQKDLIKGVKGLAKHLNIGITKAQQIINSKILQENSIAYRTGRTWHFHLQKLEDLLEQNPTILYKRNK